MSADIQPQYTEPNAAALAAGPDPFGESVVKRFGEAKTLKDLWNHIFEDAYDYGFPNRPNWNHTNEGERRTDFIFDDTLVTAIPDFASELQSGLLPHQSDIVRLMAGPETDEEDRAEVQGQLDQITDLIHSKLRNSNFFEETHEGLQDLSVGTMNMMFDVQGTLANFNFTAVSLKEAFLDCGPDGRPDGKYRLHKTKYKHIASKFGIKPKELPKEVQRSVRDNADGEVEIIEGVWRNWKKPNSFEYEYFVVMKTGSTELKRETFTGRGSNPWLSARWNASSNEVWGRGVLLNVLPTVKSLNLVMQLIFENAQVAIGGIWQYDSDGTINPDTIFLEPGTFIPREPGSRIDPLESPTRFDVAQFVIDDARKAIRKGMMVDTLDQEGKTPPSALQVGQEISQFARRIGPAYSRLHNEYVKEIFIRAVWILNDRGIIKLPKIDGKIVGIVAVSPLARAQNAQDITDFTRFVELSRFAFGEEMTQIAVKPIEGLKFLAEKVGVDTRLLKTKSEIAADVQKIKQLADENPEAAEALA